MSSIRILVSKENFPFYQVNTYDYRRIEIGFWFDFKFLVSENGKNAFALDYDEEKIPFEKWLENQKIEAEQFQKEHPDNPNKLSK